jgi:hypothetical protein
LSINLPTLFCVPIRPISPNTGVTTPHLIKYRLSLWCLRGKHEIITQLKIGASSPGTLSNKPIDFLQQTPKNPSNSAMISPQPTGNPETLFKPRNQPIPILGSSRPSEQVGQAARRLTSTPAPRNKSNARYNQQSKRLVSQTRPGYARIREWIFLEYCDTKAWYRGLIDREPGVFATIMLGIFTMLQWIRDRTIAVLFALLDNCVIFAILIADIIVVLAFSLLGHFPFLPLAVFASVILGFRIPHALWYSHEWYIGSYAWFVYLLCIYRLVCAYVYHPDAWTVDISRLKATSPAKLLSSVWIWHLFTLGAIIYGEVYGITAPFLIARE